MVQDAQEDGFGRLYGSAPAIGIPGLLFQLGRRFVALFCGAALIGLVVVRPPSLPVKVFVVLGVVLAVYGPTFGWRRLAALFRSRYCYLHEDGVTVTGLTGRVKDTVAWGELASPVETRAVGLLSSFRRFEFVRRSGPPMAVVLLAHNRAFAKELVRLAGEKLPVSSIC